jgi:uncharacterized small protein (DUF1192 family)
MRKFATGLGQVEVDVTAGILAGLWLWLAATPAPLTTAPDPLVLARSQVRALYDDVEHIARVLPMAAGRAARASCVSEKQAEARIGARLGGDELARIKANLQGKDDPRAAGERAYAQRRLELLILRGGELERAARICVDEDRSSIDVTQVQVEIAPSPAPHERERDTVTAQPTPPATSR